MWQFKFGFTPFFLEYQCMDTEDPVIEESSHSIGSNIMSQVPILPSSLACFDKVSSMPLFCCLEVRLGDERYYSTACI
jgi:hypothetical protein